MRTSPVFPLGALMPAYRVTYGSWKVGSRFIDVGGVVELSEVEAALHPGCLELVKPDVETETKKPVEPTKSKGKS